MEPTCPIEQATRFCRVDPEKGQLPDVSSVAPVLHFHRSTKKQHRSYTLLLLHAFVLQRPLRIIKSLKAVIAEWQGSRLLCLTHMQHKKAHSIWIPYYD